MKVVRLLIAALVSIVALVAAPLAAARGPAPNITPHIHYLVTPTGNVPVGPDVCADSNLQRAFNQFHWKIHVGPANAAFDHEHNPVNIISGGLCP